MSRRFVFVKKGFTKFFALFGECLPEQVYFSLVCSPKNSCLIAWYYDNPRDCKAIRINQLIEAIFDAILALLNHSKKTGQY